MPLHTPLGFWIGLFSLFLSFVCVSHAEMVTLHSPLMFYWTYLLRGSLMSMVVGGVVLLKYVLCFHFFHRDVRQCIFVWWDEMLIGLGGVHILFRYVHMSEPSLIHSDVLQLMYGGVGIVYKNSLINCTKDTTNWVCAFHSSVLSFIFDSTHLELDYNFMDDQNFWCRYAP